MRFNKFLSIIMLAFCVSCNDGSKSSEDEEYDAFLEDAKAYALSPENVARNAREDAMAGEGGSGGSNGSFLWKPRSDSDGNLVVLLPSAYVNVRSIFISGSGGSGAASRSTIANGGRPHYRFPKPGSAYGSNITISGGGRTWRVSNGGSRTEL